MSSSAVPFVSSHHGPFHFPCRSLRDVVREGILQSNTHVCDFNKKMTKRLNMDTNPGTTKRLDSRIQVADSKALRLINVVIKSPGTAICRYP